MLIPRQRIGSECVKSNIIWRTRMSDLAQDWNVALKTIEEWFDDIQLSEEEHRADNCCVDQNEVREWSVNISGVEISLAIVKTAENVQLQAFMPIMMIPPDANREALFQALLSLNTTTLSECAYGLEQEEVVVMADRSIDQMTVASLKSLMEKLVQAAQTTLEIPS
tara:strand:- start:265 stop:762 length:498 start_codon:yes stop_codon:yes gene_type:complete